MKHNGGTIRYIEKDRRYMATIHCGGRRSHHRTKTIEEAKQWIDGNIGMMRAGMAPLTPDECFEARAAVALLPRNVTLREACQFFSDQHHQRQSPALKVAVQAFLLDKQTANLRRRTIQQLRYTVGRLAVAFPERAADSITADDLGSLLASIAKTPISRNNFLRAWRSFFRWCGRRDYCDRNPAEGITRAREDGAPPGIVSPEDAAAMLRAAEKHAGKCDLRAYLALGLFAGIRSSELEALRWEDIGKDGILVRAEKTRNERLVKVEPPLSVWLRSCRRPDGPVCPVADAARRRHLAGIRKAAQVEEWPQNAMRHSYASYRLALTQDAPRVAYQLGHRSPDVLWKHYRKLVTAQAARRYFAIKPRK